MREYTCVCMLVHVSLTCQVVLIQLICITVYSGLIAPTLSQDIGFGNPTPPPPTNQMPSFYAAAQAVSAFGIPSHHQGPGAYPPPVGKGIVQHRNTIRTASCVHI